MDTGFHNNTLKAKASFFGLLFMFSKFVVTLLNHSFIVIIVKITLI